MDRSDVLHAFFLCNFFRKNIHILAYYARLGML